MPFFPETGHSKKAPLNCLVYQKLFFKVQPQLGFFWEQLFYAGRMASPHNLAKLW